MLHSMEFADSSKLFLKCRKEMNKYIQLDNEKGGSPLSGSIGSLEGVPSAEEFQDWRRLAGMTERSFGLCGEVRLDCVLTGDPMQANGHAGGAAGIDEDEEDEEMSY